MRLPNCKERVYTRTMTDPCLCTSLRHAAHNASELYDAALAPSGLKVTMYRLLKVVRANPDASLSDLAGVLDLDRSTLGRNLGVLERRGLVTRKQPADERTRSAELTEDGHAALRTAEPLWREAQAAMRARLAGSSDELLDLLQRMEA